MARRRRARDHRGIAEFTDTGGDGPPGAVPDPPAHPASDPVPPHRGSAGGGPPWWGPHGWGPQGWGPPGGGSHHRGGWHRAYRGLRGPVRRSSQTRVLAGVCGGLSQATGIDVTLIRIGFVLLALGSGIGILVYAVAWLLLPLEGEDSTIFSRAITDRRGIRLVVAIIPALVVAQVVGDALHIGYLGSFSVPVFFAAGGAILIRRNTSDAERAWINHDLLPMFRLEGGRHSRWPFLLRVAIGVVVGLAGVVVLLAGHRNSAALWPVGGAVLVVAAIVVVFGPWWLSLVRDLMAERQARALAEERAQMAAHVHDSVLQTLALIQRSADDPQHVVRLARAQERELRSWLFEGRPPGTVGPEASTLAEGVGVLQRQVEADHGVTVQVVVVGDCPLDDALRALLDASREATVNAATWSGEREISFFAEVGRDAVMVFVRDRGRGFDPAVVPDGRQGIATSIRARMARFGGSAVIRSAPGDGAEVQLSMPRLQRVP
jgi:signal transduction histidine kinase